MVERPKALIFDVFGTLVDWRNSVARHVAAYVEPEGIDPLDFAMRWRAEYQPGMERVRRGGEPYQPLEVLHLRNLDRVLNHFGLTFGADIKTELNQAWERLKPWEEVPAALKLLRGDFVLAPCSNGSIAMMNRLARYAGFQWDAILGADIAGDYKPKPAVYLESARALGLPPESVMMVAAHNSDLAAARECGLQTGFFPRPAEYGPGQKADLTPDQDWDIMDENLAGIARHLTAWT